MLLSAHLWLLWHRHSVAKGHTHKGLTKPLFTEGCKCVCACVCFCLCVRTCVYGIVCMCGMYEIASVCVDVHVCASVSVCDLCMELSTEVIPEIAVECTDGVSVGYVLRAVQADPSRDLI